MLKGITPGPWGYDTYNTIYSGRGESAKTICTIPDHPQDGFYTSEQVEERSVWYAESEANADLIAAAPDLYEALEEAEYLFAHGVGAMDMGKGRHEHNIAEAKRIMSKCRAALAKARGENPK